MLQFLFTLFETILPCVNELVTFLNDHEEQIATDTDKLDPITTSSSTMWSSTVPTSLMNVRLGSLPARGEVSDVGTVDCNSV